MTKLVKIGISGLAVIIFLLGAGAWYASSIINSEQLSALLSASVRTATGRDLKIAGPVTLSFFPRISVSAERLTLSNASWASSPEMITLKRIDFNIGMLPLLRKQIEIDSLKLTGMELFLQKNVSGKANWEMSSETLSSASAASHSLADNSAASSSASLYAIESVSVVDAQIYYRDTSGITASYQIQNLSFVQSGDNSSISISAKFQEQSWGLSGKTGPLFKLVQKWGVSDVRFPLDLNLTMNGKSMMIKGDAVKTPKAPLVINLALNSKAFDWPVLEATPHLPQRAINGTKLAAIVHQTQKPQSKFLFSNEHIPFDALPIANGKITINIIELGLPKRKSIENLQATLQLNGSVIDIPNLTFQMGKGSANVQIKLSELDTSTPALTAKGVTKDFTLENLLARLDPSSKVSEGNMKLAFDVKTSGVSLHQMAANSSGKIQVSIRQAQMGTNFLNNAGDFVVTLLDSMNPMRKKTSETVLECAVAYLPINNGLINIAKSVGLETDRLDVALAGSINLKTETINLTIDPQEKSGLTTGLDLSGMVKMGGTLANPKVSINQAGVVNSAVSIGLGFLTGGASILAENARSMTSKTHPCRDALHPWSDIYPGAE